MSEEIKKDLELQVVEVKNEEKKPSGHDEILSNEEILKKIHKAIANAHVLNGGFDRLMNEINEVKEEQKSHAGFTNELKNELSLIKRNQEESKGDIKKLKEAIYEPDSGLYKRISDALSTNSFQNNMIEEVKNNTGKLEETIVPVAYTNRKLVEISGGEELPDLNSLMSTGKLAKKIFWIVFTASCGVGLKFLYDLISMSMN